MTLLARDKSPIAVCHYLGLVDITDEEGFFTGEKAIQYSAPVRMRANVSKAGGETAVEMLGTVIDYDKVILLENSLAEDIKETDVFFLDKEYEVDSSQTPLYDYRIKRIAKTPNITAIAVLKVRND